MIKMKKNKPKFSIIIPIKEINDYLKENIKNILNQSYKNFEIIVVVDKKKIEKFPKTYIFESGNVNPADKRDLGAKKSKGEILAFIDDDAYPEKNWLKNALENFENKEITAVVGPGLTPKEDSLMQRIGGKILESKLVSGTEDYRCKVSKKRFVNDYPTFNFFIRKNIFNKIGGFNYKYWRGEDTKLCLDIIKIGGKIIYNPKVIVYHHRRALFVPHLKQVWKCALYRGFFVRKFPQTSRKFVYFVPSLFVIGLIIGFILSFFDFYLRLIYVEILIIYSILLLGERIKMKKINGGVVLIIGIFLSHITYGTGFLKGIISKKLP